VVELGRGLADALAAAHEAGVLHRDVKPANVMRTPHGTYQLADFGLARFVDATQTMGRSVLATVAYAAPEILDGKPATAASDVYSLGATLHAALRGRPPFESGPDDAPIAVAVRVLTTQPPDLRLSGVPSALAEVVERAMAREPGDRYSSAAELRGALSALDLGPPDRTEPRAAVRRDAAGLTAVLPPAPTVVTAPATRPGPLADGPPATRPQPARRGKVAAALALLVLFAAAAVVIVRNGQENGRGDQSSEEPPTSETVPPDTSAPETTAPVTTGAAEVSTTPPAAVATTVAPPGTVSVVQAVRDYYALMDAGRIDEGFALLSPAYQERTGESSYRGFWQTIHRVEVLEAQGDGLSVDATLRYTRTDGTTSTEDVVLQFVRDPGTGALLIDDYRLDPS
jgi:hypothetical protein